MSYPIIPFDNEDLLRGLPSLNGIQNTLLMIETIKNFPTHSLTSLDAPEPLPLNKDEEDSLGVSIRLDEPEAAATPVARRKKTGCTCKKTNCLKRYCECFSSGKICTPDCACYGCFNNHDHGELIQQSQAATKISSRKNTQGCTCKKSQCQKKYCQCYSSRVACTAACKCKDCQNHGFPCSSHSSQKAGMEMANDAEDPNEEMKGNQVGAEQGEILYQKPLQSFSNLGLISNFDL